MITAAAAADTFTDFRPVCPEWCSTPGEHEARDFRVCPGDDEGTVQVLLRHVGPRFGPFQGQGEGDLVSGAMTLTIESNLEVLRLAGLSAESGVLLDLADNAASAARWLESQS
ncbi:hypothetical protein [Nocardioides yefusunii]|uniref:Uncharacterized protein n=2 Tax=Nocardioides yefusunii TaxID=2500546 RepID=A0ABW1QZJ4_9ACTN|nr:hypothetical protein [Nocardioides yefusunii]